MLIINSIKKHPPKGECFYVYSETIKTLLFANAINYRHRHHHRHLQLQ